MLSLQQALGFGGDSGDKDFAGALTDNSPIHHSFAGDILHLLFRLKNQRLVEDYSCAISDQILLHGRMVRIYRRHCFAVAQAPRFRAAAATPHALRIRIPALIRSTANDCSTLTTPPSISLLLSFSPCST
jgi:hypothetical protein